MCQTIPTYYLYGLDAISADVIVQGYRVRVVERGTGRTLADVKQELDRRTPVVVQSGGPTLGWRESAPETMSTSRLYLFMAGMLPNHIGPGLDHRSTAQRVPINHRNKP
jgi:hypothetical protein